MLSALALLGQLAFAFFACVLLGVKLGVYLESAGFFMGLGAGLVLGIGSAFVLCYRLIRTFTDRS